MDFFCITRDEVVWGPNLTELLKASSVSVTLLLVSSPYLLTICSAWHRTATGNFLSTRSSHITSNRTNAKDRLLYLWQQDYTNFIFTILTISI